MRGPLVTEENSWRWTLALASVAALAVISPSFHFGQASGHDFEFHLASWMDVARQWRQGVIFPRWAVWANFGYGEPRFIFYPPASWILGAALGCVLPWWAVPSAFIVIAIMLSSLTMHRLSRDWMPPGAAVAAALFYAVNPYQLVVVYLRSDFAELLANAIFPLAVYYAMRCGGARSERGSVAGDRGVWQDVIGLALVYAFIWLCNAPAAVICSYGLALLLLVQAICRGSSKPLFAGAAGLGVGLMLAAFYVVPAAYERSWVNISQVLSSGLRPEENFLFSAILDPEHNLFNLNVSFMGMIVVGLAATGAVLSYRLAPSHRIRWAPLFALTAVGIWLMTPLSGAVWRYAPELRFVQFTWRWLSPLGVCTAFFWGQLVAHTRKPVSAILGLSIVLAATAVTILVGPVSQPWWDSEGVSIIEAQVQTERGYEGTDEYCTLGGDRTDLPVSAPPVTLAPPSGRVALQDWQPERKEFTADVPVAERAAVRLLNYPAWQVRVNGQLARAESARGTDQLLVPLPAGKNHVEIRFGETPDRIVGDVLSVVASLLLAAIATIRWRKGKAPSA